jgi:hypothetical protein
MKLPAILAISAMLFAEPIHSPDGIRLPATDPGLGREVIACEKCVWDVYWEDLLGGGDFDANDAVFRITFGIVPTKVQSVELLNRQSAFGGVLLISPAPIKEGQVVGVGYRVNVIKAPWVQQPDGVIFLTGAGSKNPDGLVHAAVYCRAGACLP